MGYLQLHAEDGQLLHRQRLHTSSAQTVSARVTGMGKTSALHCVLHMGFYLICHTINFSQLLPNSTQVATGEYFPHLLPCAGLKPDDRAEDVSMTFRDSIVKISSLSIQSLVKQHFQIRRWDDDSSSSSPLSYNIWDLRKAGPRCAGIIAGIKPPSLYGSLTGRETQPKLLLLTAGR